MHDVMRPLPMRQRNFDEVDAVAENGAQLPNAVRVGAIAAADHERTPVEPEDIATFKTSWRLDASADRHRHMTGGRRALLRGRLFHALRLAHASIVCDRG